MTEQVNEEIQHFTLLNNSKDRKQHLSLLDLLSEQLYYCFSPSISQY